MSSLLAKKLIGWQQKEGRHDLPWQKNPTPYRVWISEIMLQQTQVETVKSYYLRFMHQLPTLNDLANASEECVLQLWAGLGYYARARHLHRTAKIIFEKYHGQFPENLLELMALPGIGRSTAGAILSLSMNQSAVILDGNVKRVLTRVFAIKAWPGLPKIQNKLWDLATQHTPKQQAGIYNQALMDLGATLCTRKAPQCPLCPLRKNCLAYAQNMQEKIPHPKPKKVLPEKQGFMIILLNEKNNTVLLEKRPAPGIWGGLWCFPECEKPKEKFKLEQTSSHTFSHYRWHIQLIKKITQSIRIPKSFQAREYVWYNLDHNSPLALAAVVKALLIK